MRQKLPLFSLMALCGLVSMLSNCTCPKKNSPTTDSAQKNEAADTNKEALMKEFGLTDGQKLYATFKTSMGDMKVELFWDKAPKTVANFVGLAEGTKEWLDPKSGQKVKRPLYNGTIFHRVIPEFMIQGGDPLGNGMGGPGYEFADEFHPELRHNSKGILSMANAGPNTNGSQFFITEVPTPFLDNRHAVFGKVVDNADLINKIARVKTGRNDRPVEDIVLQQVVITRE